MTGRENLHLQQAHLLWREPDFIRILKKKIHIVVEIVTC
jgi:hypothetical protein